MLCSDLLRAYEQDYFRLKELTTDADPSGNVPFKQITSSLDSKSQTISTGFPSGRMKLLVSLSPSSFHVPSRVSIFPETDPLLMNLSFPAGIKEYSLIIPSSFNWSSVLVLTSLPLVQVISYMIHVPVISISCACMSLADNRQNNMNKVIVIFISSDFASEVTSILNQS